MKEEQPRSVPAHEQTGHAKAIGRGEATWKPTLPPHQTGRLEAFYNVQQRIAETEEQLESGHKRRYVWQENDETPTVIFEMDEAYLEKMRKIRDEKRAELVADPRTKDQAETMHQVFEYQRQEKERRVNERAKRMLSWLDDDESPGTSR